MRKSERERKRKRVSGMKIHKIYAKLKLHFSRCFLSYCQHVDKFFIETLPLRHGRFLSCTLVSFFLLLSLFHSYFRLSQTCISRSQFQKNFSIIWRAVLVILNILSIEYSICRWKNMNNVQTLR